MRGEEAGEGRGIFDGGGQADQAQAGGQGGQAGDLQHQLVAAFAFGEGVDFVDDDPLQAFEHPRRIFVCQEEGKAFGGGQQNVGRVGALAAALGVGGVAGTVLDPDRQVRTLDWAAQVAADVGGQGFEGRDVEGVEAGCGGGQFGEGGQETGESFAAAGGGDQKGGGVSGEAQHVKLVGVEGPALGVEPVLQGGGEDHGRQDRGCWGGGKGWAVRHGRCRGPVVNCAGVRRHDTGDWQGLWNAGAKDRNWAGCPGTMQASCAFTARPLFYGLDRFQVQDKVDLRVIWTVALS